MNFLDPVLLSRFQFTLVVGMHILLPAFTVGLSCYIATLEINWWLTRRVTYRRLSAFWLKIFAVSFGMGVVSGVVMPFQFGTNWSRFSDATSNIIGPLMGYEVLTAFFLEAAFLGVLLFGRARVPRWAHALSAVMVAAGTVLSSFWILAVNSWMQTPAGYTFVDGRFFPTSMMEIIFNPSLPYRLMHTVSAFVVTTAFVILGVGAWYLRRGIAVEESRVMIKMSLFFLAVAVPAQIVLGDLHGLNTLRYQPVKVAAMEGLWHSSDHAPASLFGWPDSAAQANRYELAVPGLASVLLTHRAEGVVRGLTDWPADQRPPVAPVYVAFRVMVALGIVMLLTVIAGLLLWRRGRIYASRRFLAWCTVTAPIGFVAVLAGWVVTEAGRQPWTVFGVLRTANSVSPSLTTADVGLSLALYLLAYLFIYGAGAYLILHLVRVGPTLDEADALAELDARPARPLSAVSAHGVARQARQGGQDA